MPPYSPQGLFHYCHTWQQDGFVARAAPCLGEPDAAAFAAQHHHVTARHHSMAWRAGTAAHSHDTGSTTRAGPAMLHAIAHSGFDQVVVMVQQWALPQAPAALFSAVSPADNTALTADWDSLSPAQWFAHLTRACLAQAPALDLEHYLSLTCRVHYDDASALQQLLQELDAEVLSEQYDADGLHCQLRIAGYQRSILQQQQAVALRSVNSDDPAAASGQPFV